jgi:hypothetical protein
LAGIYFFLAPGAFEEKKNGHRQRRTLPGLIGRMPQVDALGEKCSRSHSPEKSHSQLEDDR